MDTTTLAMIAAGLGGVLLGWNILGWLSALRRRSEPRPTLMTAHSYHDMYHTEGLFSDCRYCNPQPTSAPTSSEATETPEATPHG